MSLNAQEERLIANKGTPVARDRSEVAHALTRRCYPNIGAGGTVGFRAVACPCRLDFPSRTKPWTLPGPHFQTDVIYVSLNWELGRENGVYGTPY